MYSVMSYYMMMTMALYDHTLTFTLFTRTYIVLLKETSYLYLLGIVYYRVRI